MLITNKQYIEYLISTPVNYTGSNLGNHLEQISHDAVSEKCQCRKARAQSSHLTLCYRAWLSIKIAVEGVQKTIYQIVNEL